MPFSDTNDVEKAHVESRLNTRVEARDPPAAEQHAATPRRRPAIANPGAVGLFSFASTTFILSMSNVNTRGIHSPNIVVGMSLFVGGLVQLLAAMWEFPRGNTFGATAFASYGGFWLSYSAILIPGSGIIDSYSDPAELHNALGLYLITWFMVTMMFIVPVIRRHMAFVTLLSTLSVAYLLLAIGEFSGKLVVTRAGGVFGIITAFVAYYIALSELVGAEERPVIRMPLGIWP